MPATDQIINRPCTIHARSGTATIDDYGTPTWATTDIATVCALQQVARSEGDDEGELSDTSWRLFLPPTVTVGSADKVTVGGDVYEVVGGSYPVWDHLRQSVDHVEATVRRTA